MNGGLFEKWDDASFVDELLRAFDETVASRNPNLAPAPVPTPDPFATATATATATTTLPTTSVSYLPAASGSWLPAGPYPSPALCYSPPLPLPPVHGDGERLATVGSGFSPPSELSQRPTRFIGTGVGGATKRKREAREVERLKRELSRISKQMNDLKIECNELRKHKEIKTGTPGNAAAAQQKENQALPTIGVQTDSTWNSEHLCCKKVVLGQMSSGLRAIWGMPVNGLSGRNLTSKISASCSEEMLELLSCTPSDICGTSCEASSSMSEAISQVGDTFIKMKSGKIPIQTFLEALLNLCSSDNAAIVCKTLRVLYRCLDDLMVYGTKPNERNNVYFQPYDINSNHKDPSTWLRPDAEKLLRGHDMSLPFTFWSSVFTQMLEIGVTHSEESI